MILYAKGETEFNHLGLGILSDSTKAEVTEERNGAFYLDFDYPLDGKLFDELKIGAYVKADAGHKSKDQLFIIERVESGLRGSSVHAQHVSRLAEKNQLAGDVIGSGTATQAIQAWIDNLIDQSAPWSAWSDKDFVSEYSWLVEETDNAMRALGGQAGSLLQTYRGEYEFDNWDIRLWTNRGKRADTIIAYGRNLVDLRQEEEILDTVTSIMPYIYREPEEEGGETVKLTLPEVVVHSEHMDAYGAPRILKLDLSEKEEITTVEEMRAEALSYIDRNDIGKPKVSITIKHQDLSQALGYEDTPQEEIGLCDVVPIYFERLDIEVESKVIAVKWNVLLERYDELTFGSASKTLAQTLSADFDDKAEKIRDEAVRYARIAAGGKSKVYQGELEPPSANNGDIWFKQEGTETAMYRFEDGAWVRVLGTDDEIDAGRLTTGTLDAAQVNVINLDANNITAGKVSSNLIEVGNDTTYVDGDNTTTMGSYFGALENSINMQVSTEVETQLADPALRDLLQGTGVTDMTVEYSVSSSYETPPETGWSETLDSQTEVGAIVWRRFKITYTDNTNTYTVPEVVADVKELEAAIVANEAAININRNEIESRVSERIFNENIEGLTSEISNISSVVSQKLDSWEVSFREQNIDPLGVVVDAQGNRISEIEGAIRFTIDGIEISKSLSDFILALEADRLAFKQAGKDVAWMTGSKFLITDGEFLNSLKIGNFQFVPRSNGNLSIV